MRSDNGQHVDQTKRIPYLAKFLGPDKAARLVRKYLLDLAQKIDLLIKYLEDRNMKELRKIAHQLKGSGKSYGFEYITEVGDALSSCAKHEDYLGLEGLIHDLDEYVNEQNEIHS
ncbi:MAG: Hpt domain-containing protein [Thermodesulfobacteriota bacterium]|nr:Hpt domain-containing protein [Thermodesulfobacteriota bacterium]